MKESRFFRWLRRLPIPNKMNLIIGLMVAVVLVGFAGFWFGMRTMTSIRAYVAGEGLWSKAQKDAVSYLMRYAVSFDERDYAAFHDNLRIPLGDKKARLELEKPLPNYELAREGFIEGGNHPKDIDDMIFLFRTFRNEDHIDRAIATWEEGDREIARLIRVGEEIHAVVSSTQNKNDARERVARVNQIATLLTEVEEIDQKLTGLEKDFSATLGEGARYTGSILFRIVFILTVIVGAAALFAAVYLGKMIASVDNAKSEFVSLASHQLRTPLTLISWYAEKLLRDFDELASEDRKEYLSEVYKANRRMTELVNTLLSTSRIELGTFAYKPTKVNLKNMIDRVLGDLSPQIETKKLTIDTHYAIPDDTLHIDPNLLEIVLQNILANAVQYSPEGGNVRIRADRKEKRVVLSVSDSGAGIAKEDRHKIFTKLYRTQEARDMRPDGTGLGLYICKHVVELWGGSIWFESAQGKGTTFFVSIPV